MRMNLFAIRIFYIFFYIIFSSFLISAFAPTSQIEGLEFLFNATNGENWNWMNEVVNGPKWSFTTPQPDPCNDNNKVWQGITCSSPPNICKIQGCEIISLQLEYYGLNGSLPPEFFTRLASLTTLQLSSSRRLGGTIPSEIGSLIQCTLLSLYSNQLTGPIPSELGSLSNLSYLFLDTNELSSQLPSTLGFLKQLKILFLDSNNLTGSLPSEIGLLTQLTYFSIHSNELTGSIPSEIGQLSGVNHLFLDLNHLTGQIPSTIGSLTQLKYLYLDSNKLTGTILSELGLLSQLNNLYLDFNLLSGSIPVELGLLSKLNILFLDYNQLTGLIPSTLGSLTQLNYLYLDSNELNGTIPLSLFHYYSNLKDLDLSSNQLTGIIPKEIGLLTNLEELHCSDNYLTGIIPSSITNLKNLTQLHLYQNHLKGEIHFPLHSFPYLEQLFLQQNHFHGHLLSLFSTSNFSNHSLLMNIDVSDNQFSGSIPSQLFLLPHLQSISLSLNCFQHELPPSMCEAVGVGVISMDGLGSSKHCPNLVKIPFTSVSLVQSIEGSIPNCVWLLSNLKTLNLAGNGLSGSIAKISSMSSLLSLTLSHNYLSGTIPLWLQEKNMSQLDLSHNKLTGRINRFKKRNREDYNEEVVNTTIGSKYEGRSLKLSVNRLSGDLSHSFDKYSILDILSGNLFGCDYTPSNDENSDFTICGSEEFDQSMIVMGGVCGLIVMVVIFYGLCLLMSFILSSFYLTSRDPNSNAERGESQNNENSMGLFLLWFESRLVDFHSILHYLRYYSVDRFFLRNSFTSIRSFGYFLSRLIKSVCLLTIILLIFSLPIYVLKVMDVKSQYNDQSEYVTHSEMYRWLWTMSFISGTIPSVLLMLVALISLMLFCLIVNGLACNKEKNITNDGDGCNTNDDKKRDNVMSDRQFTYVLWVIFVVNIAIVGTANALYLWSTLKDLPTNTRILIQFSFGFFTFVWRGFILRRGLSSHIKESKNGLFLFTCLNIVNTVLIPCVVTALSDPSCYQILIIPPDDISSSYSYQTCYTYLFLPEGTSSCLYFGPALMNSLQITPPFTYSYQCGSTLLVSYIPVYMYSVSLQLFSTIIILGISFFITASDLHFWLMKFLSPIHFPLQFSNKTTDSTNTTIQLMKPYQMISLVMNNLILLLSFGLCCPVLSCYITLNICVILGSWLILIGRFVDLRLDCHYSSNLSSLLVPSEILRKTSSLASENRNISSQLEMNPIQSNIHIVKDDNANHLENVNLVLQKCPGRRSGEEGDVFLNLLNLQLEGVNSSVVVCKWPIVCTSCLFVTLLCWDMAGDEVGWYRALWVPGMGVAMIITIWIWDQFLISHVLRVLDQHLSSYSSSSSFPSFSQSSTPVASSPSSPPLIQ